MKDCEKKFSICIPTFNRGERALDLVKKCLPNLNNDWELLILDNCSDRGDSYYKKIETLSQNHDQLNYIKHDSNRMFAGNFLACFDHSRSPIIMVCSDEDMPNIEFVKHSLSMMKNNLNLGLIAGSVSPLEGVTPGNSYNLPDAIYERGKDALLKYGFMRNYLSGGVYNKAKIFEYNLHERLRSGIAKHWAYPHLYLEILIAAKCDIQLSSLNCCFEGKAEATDIVESSITSTKDNHSLKYKPPYSFGARIDQFIALRDAAYEAASLLPEGFDIDTFFIMYLSLFSKYLRLVGLSNAPLYTENMMFPSFVQESLYSLARSAVVMYPEMRPYLSLMLEKLEEIFEGNKVKVSTS